jgi:hypothetical protein
MAALCRGAATAAELWRDSARRDTEYPLETCIEGERQSPYCMVNSLEVARMKTLMTSEIPQRLPGLSVRGVAFVLGLVLATIGAYLILSGSVVLVDHETLPGLLDLLVGFLFVSVGWRFVQPRR